MKHYNNPVINNVFSTKLRYILYDVRYYAN